ncbi:hypothetical protein Tco_1205216, partial [Tanacetum coccineum]
HDSDEDTSQDYLREEELILCLENEEMLRCEHEKLIVEENSLGWMRQTGQPGQVKCKFPWNDDYTIDRNFWLKLVCLDLARKGWLTEEELAVLYPNMVPNYEKFMEVFIGGLPRSIEGNVTASKPQTLEEAITITQRLIEQKGNYANQCSKAQLTVPQGNYLLRDHIVLFTLDFLTLETNFVDIQFATVDMKDLLKPTS